MCHPTIWARFFLAVHGFLLAVVVFIWQWCMVLKWQWSGSLFGSGRIIEMVPEWQCSVSGWQCMVSEWQCMVLKWQCMVFFWQWLVSEWQCMALDWQWLFAGGP